MNDQLQSNLIEILDSIQTATGRAADFTMSQLPDVAQQYVVYGRAAATVGFVLSWAVFGMCVYVALKWGFLRKAVDSYGDWTGSRQAAAFLGSVAGVVAFAWALLTTRQLFLVWLAPKAWLLQELARLIK